MLQRLRRPSGGILARARAIPSLPPPRAPGGLFGVCKAYALFDARCRLRPGHEFLVCLSSSVMPVLLWPYLPTDARGRGLLSAGQADEPLSSPRRSSSRACRACTCSSTSSSGCSRTSSPRSTATCTDAASRRTSTPRSGSSPCSRTGSRCSSSSGSTTLSSPRACRRFCGSASS